MLPPVIIVALGGTWLTGFVTSMVALYAWREYHDAEAQELIDGALYLKWERKVRECRGCTTFHNGTHYLCGEHRETKPVGHRTYDEPVVRSVFWFFTLPIFLTQESGEMLGDWLKRRHLAEEARVALVNAQAQQQLLQTRKELRALNKELGLPELADEQP